MAETEPGGRYRGTDGTWHDANGAPLEAPAPEPEPDGPKTPEKGKP